MKYKKFCIFWLCISFSSIMFCKICGFAARNFQGIPVFDSQSSVALLEYDNCNQKTNGEFMILNQLLKESKIVFDVGANHGEWSLYAKKMNSHIKLFSFEPVPSTFELLKCNLQNLEAQAYCIAFSDFNGQKNFFYYTNNSEASTHYRRDQAIENKCGLGVPTQITVECCSLDSFCTLNKIDSIDFLKIDTEGSEFDVLMGASNMLSKLSIKMIQFEYGGTFLSAGVTLKQVWDLLNSYGYDVYCITSRGLVAMPEWHESYENYRYSNYLALMDKICLD